MTPSSRPAVSPLRAVLVEIERAQGATSLDALARRVGVSPDEVRAMVEYWQRRGRLVVAELGGCEATGCGSCPVAGRGASSEAGSCPAPDVADRRLLRIITLARES